MSNIKWTIDDVINMCYPKIMARLKGSPQLPDQNQALESLRAALKGGNNRGEVAQIGEREEEI